MRPSLREPLITFVAATALAAAAYWSGRSVPFVQRNLHAVVAVIFLYAPAVASRISGTPFDYRDAGLGLGPARKGLLVLVATVAVTFPLFILGFFLFYRGVCEAPPLPFSGAFGSLCSSWRGVSNLTLRWPPDFALLAASQLIVVAVPEELFFRGYLMGRLEARWPPGRRLLGAPVGRAWLISSVLFALGHLLVDFNPQRLAVFFPGLVFGWMRAATGSLAAGAVYHALCNLLSDVLHTSAF